MSSPMNTERPASAGRFPRDFWVGIVLLVFCAAAYWVTLDFKQAPAALAQNVQPATFPRLVIFVVAILSLLMMVVGFAEQEPRRSRPKAIMGITALMMVGFIFAFDILGLTAAVALFSLVMPVLWGAKPSLKLVAFAVAFPAAVYLVFDVGLDVYFPPGILSALTG